MEKSEAGTRDIAGFDVSHHVTVSNCKQNYSKKKARIECCIQRGEQVHRPHVRQCLMP